jgi:lysophospholipid acyltransferase (LPLAT)-like uncharacterized protein
MNFYKKFKKLYKKYIFNNDIIFYTIIILISIIAYLYLRFVILTSKITFKLNNNKPEDLKNKTYILAFWHGRLLSAFFIRKYFSHSCVLISHNKSAYLVKLIANYFFTSVIKGSSNKSDLTSIRNIIKYLKENKRVFAIAPDGSIGPRLHVKEGVATLALLSKTPILPITYSAKFAIIVNSWDKFMIPLPFNKIMVDLEDAIDPMSNNFEKNPSKIRNTLEERLTNKLYELDTLFNHKAITKATHDKKGRPLSDIK